MTKIFTAQEVVESFERHGSTAFKLQIKSSQRVSQFGAMFIEILMKFGESFVPIIMKEANEIITINSPYHKPSADGANARAARPGAVIMETPRIAFNPSDAMIRAIQIIDKFAIGELKRMIADPKTAPFGLQQYRRAINEFSAFKLIQFTRHQTDEDGAVIDDVPLDAPIIRSCVPYKRDANAEPTWIIVKDVDGALLHPKPSELNAIIPRGSKIRAAFCVGPIVLSAPGGRQTISMRFDVQGIAITERGEPKSDRAQEIADQL